jgi:hypothetical protein
MLNETPEERPCVKTVQSHRFFDAKPVDMRDCESCLDKFRLEDGLACTAEHFYCKSCAESGVSSNYLGVEPNARLGDDGSVGCLHNCGARLSAKDLVKHLSQETYEKVQELAQVKRDVAIEKKLRLEFDARLKVELDRKVDDVILTRHRNEIFSLLSVNCPRCKRVFIDFEGCFALTCGCGCGFCAYCFKDCGNDAHRHVAACPSRPARQPSGNDVHDIFFGSEDEFKNAKKVLVSKRVDEYWHSEVIKLSDLQRKELSKMIMPLLKDDVVLPELRQTLK